jgi:hypothetical protein
MPDKKRRGIFAGALTVLVLMALLSACSKSGSPGPAADPKSFDSASAELKNQWNEVQTAVGTNGYAAAILGCRKLLQTPGLTPEQSTTVIATQTAVQNKMFDAAQKGDAAAAADVKMLQTMPR